MVEQVENQWLKRIQDAREYHSKKWAKMGLKAMKTYENSDKSKPVYHPILSNVVNVQQGAIITKSPDVVIGSSNELTYADDTIAQVYEKCLDHYADESDLGSQGVCASKDFLTSGLGTIRVDAFEGEGVVFRHVSWLDFTFMPCPTFKDCGWIAFKHYINTKDMLETYKDCDIRDEYKEVDSHSYWEIWDKDSGQIIIVSKSVDKELEIKPPDFKFKKFFPIPEPILMDKKSNEFIPVVEFGKWEKLHEIVNKLTAREVGLIDNIKAATLYDKDAFGELVAFEDDADNEYYPINAEKIRGQGGQLNLSNVLVPKDNSATVNTLTQVVATRDQTLGKIYQITGISNEMQQGISDLKETATSSRIKQGWGSSRLDIKRRAVHRMIKCCYGLAAEIMTQMDQAELVRLSGMEVSPEELTQMVEFIESGGFDTYTIDIETSTSLAIDKQEEQEQKIKFISAVSEFSTSMMQSVQANMIPYSAYVSMLKLISSNFPNARALNDEFDQMAQNNDMIQQLNMQLQELQGQLEAMGQENQAMQFELARRSEADMAKVAAEADLKEAQALKTDVETAQKAAESVVTPDMVYDDVMAINSIQQPQIPVNYPQ